MLSMKRWSSDASITACLQMRGGVNEFKISSVNNRHFNCTSAAAKRCSGAVVFASLGAGIVAVNDRLSDNAVAASIKIRVGHEPKQWTRNRIKNAALKGTNLKEAAGYDMVPLFLDDLMS